MIICEIIVQLLVIVKNKSYEVFKSAFGESLTPLKRCDEN